ncbi:MAG: hypothetical protein ACYDAK_04860 [Candidatus Limnocylindrales bacterium]
MSDIDRLSRAAGTLALQLEATTTLEQAERFPLIQLERRHGRTIAFVASGATFVSFIGPRHRRGLGDLVRALALSGAVGVSLAYMHELTVVIAETLLPE